MSKLRLWSISKIAQNNTCIWYKLHFFFASSDGDVAKKNTMILYFLIRKNVNKNELGVKTGNACMINGSSKTRTSEWKNKYATFNAKIESFLVLSLSLARLLSRNLQSMDFIKLQNSKNHNNQIVTISFSEGLFSRLFL